jgi:hypothetical protein
MCECVSHFFEASPALLLLVLPLVLPLPPLGAV